MEPETQSGRAYNPMERFAREALDPRLQEIARIALRRGLRPAKLAELAGFDRASLLRQFTETGSQSATRKGYGVRSQTISKYAKALDIRPVHLRAVVGELTERDLHRAATQGRIDFRDIGSHDRRVRIGDALDLLEANVFTRHASELCKPLTAYVLARERVAQKIDEPVFTPAVPADMQGWWAEHRPLSAFAEALLHETPAIDLFQSIRGRRLAHPIPKPEQIVPWVVATWDLLGDTGHVRHLLGNILHTLDQSRPDLAAEVRRHLDGVDAKDETQKMRRAQTRMLYGGVMLSGQNFHCNGELGDDETEDDS